MWWVVFLAIWVFWGFHAILSVLLASMVLGAILGCIHAWMEWRHENR